MRLSQFLFLNLQDTLLNEAVSRPSSGINYSGREGSFANALSIIKDTIANGGVHSIRKSKTISNFSYRLNITIKDSVMAEQYNDIFDSFVRFREEAITANKGLNKVEAVKASLRQHLGKTVLDKHIEEMANSIIKLESLSEEEVARTLLVPEMENIFDISASMRSFYAALAMPIYIINSHLAKYEVERGHLGTTDIVQAIRRIRNMLDELFSDADTREELSGIENLQIAFSDESLLRHNFVYEPLSDAT